MKLSAESGSGNLIRSFRPGELRLAEHTIESHVILSASEIIKDWKPAPFQELSIADFEPAIALQPEIILFGTGEQQHFPDNALMTDIMRQGIAFEVMDTAAACRTFNVLVSEFRQVVAALLIRELPQTHRRGK